MAGGSGSGYETRYYVNYACVMHYRHATHFLHGVYIYHVVLIIIEIVSLLAYYTVKLNLYDTSISEISMHAHF